MYRQHIIIILLLLFGCANDPLSNESPFDVEWEAGYTSSYTYSGGVNNGQTYRFKFTVINGSGNLELSAEVIKGGDDKDSVIHEVVEGKSYTFKLPVYYSGSKSCTSGSEVATIEINAGNSTKMLNFKCGSSSGYQNYSIGSPTVE